MHPKGTSFRAPASVFLRESLYPQHLPIFRDDLGEKCGLIFLSTTAEGYFFFTFFAFLAFLSFFAFFSALFLHTFFLPFFLSSFLAFLAMLPSLYVIWLYPPTKMAKGVLKICTLNNTIKWLLMKLS